MGPGGPRGWPHWGGLHLICSAAGSLPLPSRHSCAHRPRPWEMPTNVNLRLKRAKLGKAAFTEQTEHGAVSPSHTDVMSACLSRGILLPGHDSGTRRLLRARSPASGACAGPSHSWVQAGALGGGPLLSCGGHGPSVSSAGRCLLSVRSRQAGLEAAPTGATTAGPSQLCTGPAGGIFPGPEAGLLGLFLGGGP